MNHIKTKCQICQKELAQFRLTNHIMFFHKDWTTEKYIEKFGEFRINKEKSNQKELKKLNSSKQIVCKICNAIEDVSSFRGHLRWKHPGLDSNLYAQRFGEFRPKKLERQAREHKLKCEICQESLLHHRQLLFHLHEHKEITWQEYFVKYFFNGNPPTCKCGCEEKVELLMSGKNDKGEMTYRREFYKTHGSFPPIGGIRTEETKKQMRLSAIKRIENEKGLFKGISKMEKEFKDFVSQNYNGQSDPNNTSILSGLELDLYLPELKLAFEFNGTYYHSDLHKKKDYHLNKTKECNILGIKLIHIWDSEWLHKKDILKSMILNQLNKTSIKIFARKCVIKQVDAKTSGIFLNKNHLQGNTVSKYNLGLYYNNDLVSVMTFSKLRKNLGQSSLPDNYELTRFCNKLNISVIGGASKLLSYFIKNYQPKKILTYANRDWSSGEMYKKLKMTELTPTSPGYDWFKSKIRYNRYNFRKDVLVSEGADKNQTEYEIMLSKGFYRVWNTGNLKFEWNA